ncbi:hypothetical protein [Atribacter sp.]|uniref:hypothetical protein n=1 Tax=Atribacter sp. TaxID=2847780 RepID=UPI00345E2839
MEKIKKDEILTSSGRRHRTLRMTEWVDEIATSPNQRSVELLAMTDLDSFSLDGRRSG